MRKILLIASIAALAPAAASAADPATWIAACYDGKDLQYNQTIGGKGFLYLQMASGAYQGIKLVQLSYDGSVICSASDDQPAPGKNHFLKVCADKANNTISVKYTDPAGKEPSISDATPYCKAAVTVH